MSIEHVKGNLFVVAEAERELSVTEGLRQNQNTAPQPPRLKPVVSENAPEKSRESGEKAKEPEKRTVAKNPGIRAAAKIPRTKRMLPGKVAVAKTKVTGTAPNLKRTNTALGKPASLKQREVAKIAGYYDDLEAELNKKLLAANDQDKKARLEKQLSATWADRARREKDVVERYGVEVDVRLDHVVVYKAPCLRVKLDVQHKDTVLNLTVLYNPLSGEVEAPVCPRCGQIALRLEPDREMRFICAGGCQPES